jgi:hypothetical protein
MDAQQARTEFVDAIAQQIASGRHSS